MDAQRELLAEQARRLFVSLRVLYEDDHIVLETGRHVSTYVDFDPLFAREPGRVRELSRYLAFCARRISADVIVGAEPHGAKLAQGISQVLLEARKQHMPSASAWKDGVGNFHVTSELMEMVLGRRCLIVDDATATGHRLFRCAKIVREAGGSVIGALVLWDRREKSAAELGLPLLESVVAQSALSWAPAECPMCRVNRPLNFAVGHARLFYSRLVPA